METKDICDIHDFNYDLLKNLCWTCPQTGESNKGAFYTKQKPSKNNPLFELKSYLDVIAIWKPRPTGNSNGNNIVVIFGTKIFLLIDYLLNVI